MRSTYLIAGALVLALVAAGVLFGTDFFRKNPFGGSDEAAFLTEANGAAASGGFAGLFSERDARKWRLANGHRLERFSLDQSGAVFARLTSAAPLDKSSTNWAAQGLTITFPPQLNNATAGQSVEIGLAARSAQTNGSDAITVVYATQQAGNSGWKEFKLNGEFQLFTFKYKVPKLDGAYVNGPIIVITSDAAGAGRSVELVGVYVKPVR
jgi:hypothetical protein